MVKFGQIISDAEKNVREEQKAEHELYFKGLETLARIKDYNARAYKNRVEAQKNLNAVDNSEALLVEKQKRSKELLVEKRKRSEEILMNMFNKPKSKQVQQVEQAPSQTVEQPIITDDMYIDSFPSEIRKASSDSYRQYENISGVEENINILKRMAEDIDYDKIYTGGFRNQFSKVPLLRKWSLSGGDRGEIAKFDAIMSQYLANRLQNVKGDKSEKEIAIETKTLGDLGQPKSALLFNINKHINETSNELKKAKFMISARDQGISFGSAENLYADYTSAEKEKLEQNPEVKKAETVIDNKIKVEAEKDTNRIAEPTLTPDRIKDFNVEKAGFKGEEVFEDAVENANSDEVEDDYKDYKKAVVEKTEIDIENIGGVYFSGKVPIWDQFKMLAVNFLAPFEDDDKIAIMSTMSDNFSPRVIKGREYLVYKEGTPDEAVLDVNKPGFSFEDVLDFIMIVAPVALMFTPLAPVGATANINRILLSSTIKQMAVGGVMETGRQYLQSELGGEVDPEEIVGGVISPLVGKGLIKATKLVGSPISRKAKKIIKGFKTKEMPDIDWKDAETVRKYVDAITDNNFLYLSKITNEIPKDVDKLSQLTGIRVFKPQALNDPNLLVQMPYLATTPGGDEIAKKALRAQTKEALNEFNRVLDEIAPSGEGNLKKALISKVDKLKTDRRKATKPLYDQLFRETDKSFSGIEIKDSLFKEITEFKQDILSKEFFDQRNPSRYLYGMLDDFAEGSKVLKNFLPETRSPTLEQIETTAKSLTEHIKSKPKSKKAKAMLEIIDKYTDYLDEVSSLSEPSEILYKISKSIPDKVTPSKLHGIKMTLDDQIDKNYNNPTARGMLTYAKNNIVNLGEKYSPGYKEVNKVYADMSKPISKIENVATYKKIMGSDELEAIDLTRQVLKSLKSKPQALKALRKNVESVNPKLWDSIVRDFLDSETLKFNFDTDDAGILADVIQDNFSVPGQISRLLSGKMGDEEFWLQGLIPEKNKESLKNLIDILKIVKKGRNLGSPTASRETFGEVLKEASTVTPIPKGNVLDFLINSSKNVSSKILRKAVKDNVISPEQLKQLKLVEQNSIISDLIFNPQSQEVISSMKAKLDKLQPEELAKLDKSIFKSYIKLFIGRTGLEPELADDVAENYVKKYLFTRSPEKEYLLGKALTKAGISEDIETKEEFEFDYKKNR